MSPFHCAKFKKTFSEPIQSFEDVSFLGPKWPICPEHICFGTNHYYYHHLPIGTFQWAKFLKKFFQQLQSHEDTPFWNPKRSLCPKQTFFLEKIMNIIFIYLLAPFIVKNFKKILAADPELWGCTIFWAINGLFATMRIFFRKPVNNPCSFHLCLSTCQISKSDDDLLKTYWWLKNAEISLAKRHFWL